MRVFFTSSNRTQAKYQPFTEEILTLLNKTGVTLMTTEDHRSYSSALEALEAKGFKSERAHYEFVTRSIAESDVMIVEASHQSFRLGHEVTLALLYGKPTLVVSQERDYTAFISHNLLVAAKYETKKELQNIVKDFLKKMQTHFSKMTENTQIIGMAVDNMHMVALADPRANALRDPSEFGDLARLAEESPAKAFDKVQKMLGHLPAGEAMSAFAPVYQYDTPDYILGGVSQFVRRMFAEYEVEFDSNVIDVMTHTGAFARYLTDFGYQRITAFDSSRYLLAEAFRLCAEYPGITISEARPETIRIEEPAHGGVWLDFTTNRTLTAVDLQKQLQSLLDVMAPGSCFIFDVRTSTGWHSRLFSERVLAFASDDFQRIQLNDRDDSRALLTSDLFIRLRRTNGGWGEWQRERIVERMWTLGEVKDIVNSLKDVSTMTIYDDNFQQMKNTEEPGLAYFVLKKQQ